MDAQIFCSYDEFYKSPFGAAQTGEAVTFKLSVPCQTNCTTPYLFINGDNREAVAHLMTKTETVNGRDLFSVSITIGSVGLYFYYFDLYINYQKLFCGQGGCAYITTDTGPKWQLTVYESGFSTPDWMQGAVMYQIFPDRFYEGVKDKTMPFFERVYRQDKENEPYFWPNEQHEGYLNMDYYGGDFVGIQEKLPYLESLGVTCLYLNPIFEAHSNHRYNTADYLKPDPILGTIADFKKLCSAAKAMGIKIILDGVFSHTGSDSVYFNREGRYPSLGAYQGEQSPYRNWFDFGNNFKCGYRSWWGFETLPEVNENNEDYRKFICGKGGVIDYWLQNGADGFRLDVADELPDDFIELLRIAVKRNGNDKVLLGEVWEDATNKESYGTRRTYLLGKGLDSVMNYPFRTAIVDYMHTGNAKNAVNAFMSICEHYPAPALHTVMNFLSTHDTIRGITALAGEDLANHDRYWQSGRLLGADRYEFGKRLCRLAYAMIFTLPGVPSIYYGDEIFMQGYKDPFNRAYFNWHSTDEFLRDEIKKLSAKRKCCDAFNDGKLIIHETTGGFLHYERRNQNSCAHIFINRTQNAEHRAVLGSIHEIAGYNYLVLTSDSLTK